MALGPARHLVVAALFLLLPSSVLGQPQSLKDMAVVGYADRLSVQPGETIRFMVSSRLPRYRADIVRIIHGDMHPRGPGLKEEEIKAMANKEYSGRYQELPNGSYVRIPDSPALRQTGSFTITAWIAPTLAHKGPQGVVTKWSETDRLGYAMVIDRDGLGLWLGEKDGRVEKVSTGTPFRSIAPALVWPGGHQMTNTTNWYFVAASFDARSGKVTLHQEPMKPLPLEDTRAVAERTVSLRSVGASDTPLLIAAFWNWRDAALQDAGGYFNGKIEAPKVFSRVLSRAELDAIKQGRPAKDPVAAWDFEADINSRRVSDTSSNRLHGETVQMPARAMTGRNWSGRETAYHRAKGEYGAIYFHEDDLDDAGWKVDFEYVVPSDLRSGVYAARLRAGNGEDYVPFFVRPKKGTATARIAFLVPTFSYLAYGRGVNDLELLSLYERHTDGSGVSYSSRLRPILNMRPKFFSNSRITGARYVHQLPADLHFIDWMEVKGHKYDIITDEDLHWEGVSLLSNYKVVMIGSHPEYWSGQMLDAVEQYLEKGGRFMYMGGNGLYWVTSMDPERKHTIEVRRRDGTQTWEAAPGEYFHSTTGEFGGLWRFRGRPPQKLVGAGFAAQASDAGRPYKRNAASFDPRVSWMFEGIGPDELLGDFPSLVLDYGAAGLEVDRADVVLGTPPHALIVATATGFSDHYQHVVEEVMQSNSLQSGSINPYVRGDMVFFETPNGGAVFSVSSISYSGSLSYNNYNNNISRLTDNVLRRFAADAPIAVPDRRATESSAAGQGRER